MTVARAISRKLMDGCVAIAPESLGEWVEAMRSESEYVEDSAELLRWSFGCFAIALRESILQAFSRRLSTGGRGWSSGGTKELTMRKVILVTSVTLATLFGFLLAPNFRQAITVAGSPYVRIVSRTPIGPSVSYLLAMRDRAVANHDARALAAIALLMAEKNPTFVPPLKSEATYEGEQSIAIAEQAAALDPSYTFVYLQVAELNEGSSRFPQLIEALHRWDPDNAAIYLAEARHSVTGGWKGPNATNWQEERGPVWTANMDKAFHSPKYDTYYARNYGLILWASANHILQDPMAITFAASRVPLAQFGDIRRYSQQLLSDDSRTQAQKLASAREVAQFADVMATGAVPWIEKTLAQGIASDAIRAMNALSGGQDAVAAQLREQVLKSQPRVLPVDPSMAVMMALQSNASAAQISVLIMALSLLVLAFIAIRSAIQRCVSHASVVALWVNAGVFSGSCLTCYISYRPFAAILEYLEHNPNPSNARLSYVFWSFLDNPLVNTFNNPVTGWTLLLVLCGLTLAWVIGRNIVRYAHRSVAAAS